ncbi:UNVERIFIED_CONTAM: hypothetical protein K2H54_051794 [Gekko kuhli]
MRITSQTRTMAAAPGHLSEFDPAHPEFWETWVELFKYFVLFQDIEGKEKKKALLLSSCGIATLRRVHGLIVPTMPLTTHSSSQEEEDDLEPSPPLQRTENAPPDNSVQPDGQEEEGTAPATSNLPDFVPDSQDSSAGRALPSMALKLGQLL